MILTKYEGIKKMQELNIPTITFLDLDELLSNDNPITDEISVRLSPKSKMISWNVGLPSINRRTDKKEIQEFVDKYKNNYIVFAHKTVKPNKIGTICKFEDSLVIETYNNFDEKHDEMIDNRIIVPMLGDRYNLSRIELLKDSKEDLTNFKNVIEYLKRIPYDNYEMEYVIQDDGIIFIDFTISDKMINNYKEPSDYKIYRNI